LPSLLVLLPLLAVQSQQLTATELSLGGTALVAHQLFAGAELGLARRPAADSRIALALAAGTEDGRAAGRVEVTLQLLVNAFSQSGPGVYAGVGGAFAARQDSPGRGFLAVLVGFEAAPARRQAWYVELGFAGGVRAAAGWRLRWFPAWWRPR
jgi:hypothetical protein